MYDYFKIMLDAAESIGKIEKAELSKYGAGYVSVCGTLEDGKTFDLTLRLEDK